jgi:hypothetical protein
MATTETPVRELFVGGEWIAAADGRTFDVQSGTRPFPF